MKSRRSVYVLLLFAAFVTFFDPHWLLIAFVTIVGLLATRCLVVCARRP